MTGASETRARHVVVLLGVVFLVLVLGNHLAARLTAPVDEAPLKIARRESVRVLPREPVDLPPPEPGRPAVLLMGNSHTYALPGLEPGRALRPDPGATLIDELEARVREREGETGALFYRLSYPNFLPFEMLARYGQLSRAGYRPRVVILGLTWRNVARERTVRHQVRRAFEDDGFTAALLDRLAALGAPEEVLEAARGEERQVAFERRQDLQRSAADRLDAGLTASLGEHVALIGRSSEVRALVYREIAYGIEDLLIHEEAGDYSYEVIEEDLRFNLACLRVLLRWFAADGARVLVYRAPERSDLPALMDPARQAEVLDELLATGEWLVVDARDAVPPEFWGWERNTPDRSHFTEPGHQLLAERLVAAGARAGFWAGLQGAR